MTLSAEGMGGAPTAQDNSFTSKMAGLMKVSHPGSFDWSERSDRIHAEASSDKAPCRLAI